MTNSPKGEAMNTDKIESLLIDYIDGRLNDSDRSVIKQELARDPSVRQLYEQLREVMAAVDNTKEIEPGSALRKTFNKHLQEEISKEKPTKTRFFQPMMYRIAAGVVLVMAVIYIGNWISKNQQREEEMLALRKEVEATKQMMLLMLDNQQSASQRMVGTAVAYKIDKADDEIVDALVKAMNEDPNTNVRLAALDALVKFHEDPRVKKQLIKSLSIQKDPVVQITLIQFLVRMEEKDVAPQLQIIIDDARTIKAVKDEAYTGLLKLS